MAKLDFVPSEHVTVGFFVRGEISPRDSDLARNKERCLALLQPWNGKCWRCGAWLKYVVVTRHDSGQYRALGEDCSDHLLSADDEYQLRLLKEAQARAVSQVKNQEARDKFKAEEPEVYALLLSAKDEPGDHLDFVVSVSGQFFGDKPNLSDRQIDALKRCVVGRKKFEENRAKRAAERKPTAVVPVGKGVEIVGEVVKVDVKENDFGIRTVFTVKTQEGWLVWGTVPSSLSNAKVGDWVKFVANTEASPNDDAFGFFQRPRKGEFLEGEPEAPITECVKCGASLESLLYDACPTCREVPF